MIGYYKKHIYALSEAVSAIRSCPERVEQLKGFQVFLISRILKTEKKIDEIKISLSALKSELRSSRPTKEKSKEIKKKIGFYQKRVKEHQWMLFVWRCFGDAVAFLYLDKYAIKPFLYEFGANKQKQSSGRLAGKEGLGAELSVAFDALEHGVPAILCDLTNCIRHGDVCLLGSSDPEVIEVKTSTNTNLRIDRQLDAISGLHEYLETDQSEKLFGVSNVKRVELGVPEVNYQSSIAQQIARAKEDGYHHNSPEKGLHIFVINGAKLDELGNAMSSLDRPIVFFLNETKNAEAWGNYYPFILSINQPDELYAFLKGSVYIMVVVELGVCEALAHEKGWQLNYRESGNYAFEFTETMGVENEPFRFKLSRHFLGRVGHEFLSLKWIMDFQEHNNREIKALITESDNA